jgi:hypothetical protein
VGQLKRKNRPFQAKSGAALHPLRLPKKIKAVSDTKSCSFFPFLAEIGGTGRVARFSSTQYNKAGKIPNYPKITKWP